MQTVLTNPIAILTFVTEADRLATFAYRIDPESKNVYIPNPNNLRMKATGRGRNRIPDMFTLNIVTETAERGFRAVNGKMTCNGRHTVDVTMPVNTTAEQRIYAGSEWVMTVGEYIILNLQYLMRSEE